MSLKITCLLAFISFSRVLFADIYEVRTIDKILPFIKEDMLVIFDLDNTLIETVQELGSDQWFCHKMANAQKKEKESESAFDKVIQEYYTILNITKVRCVEEKTKEVFAILQRKELPIMSLTARGMALYWATERQLASVGIDFTKKTPYKKELYFRKEREIFWQNGILFAQGTDKGETLFHFFDLIDYKPKSICFVDDKLSSLMRVQRVCEREKIPFVGLRYSYLDKKIESYSSNLPDMQLSSLQEILLLGDKKEIFLSDKEKHSTKPVDKDKTLKSSLETSFQNKMDATQKAM